MKLISVMFYSFTNGIHFAPLQKFILIVYISQLEKTTRYVRISNIFFIILSDGYDLMAYDFRDGISIKKEEKVLAKAIGGGISYIRI